MRSAYLLAGVGVFSLVMATNFAAAKIQHAPPEWTEGDKPKPLEPYEAQFPSEVEWTLTDMNGKPPIGEAPSLRIDSALRATGFSGCNTYSMTLYPIKGQKLAAGGIAQTRKECDKPVMSFERDFLVGLHSLPAWSLQGEDLTIKAPNATMHFRRGI